MFWIVINAKLMESAQTSAYYPALNTCTIASSMDIPFHDIKSGVRGKRLTSQLLRQGLVNQAYKPCPSAPYSVALSC